MNTDFMTSIKSRRSIYEITKETTIPDYKLKELIQDAVKHVPSAFNSQSMKIVLLLGENHDRLWDITKEILRGEVPADKFEPTEKKMEGFKAGYGTILYYDDTSITNALMERFPLYKDKFPLWAHHGNGMLQFALWNILENEGLGASLQHYNPLIDQRVAKEWNLPQEWQLVAQMPFGKVKADYVSKDKEFLPIESRIKIYG